MIHTEKINIYMPEFIRDRLMQDMEMFEIFKPNSWDVNHNQFLTLLIKGYYNAYVQENNELRDKVIAALKSTALSVEAIQTAADAVITNVFDQQPGKRVGKNAKMLSLKPTKEIESILQCIENEGNDYLSRFFCRMFTRYTEKPFHQRKRIIFKATYDILQECCKARRSVIFSTSGEPGRINEVLPYAVTVGREEMFNYLLCQKTSEKSHQAKSFALRRIRNVIVSQSKETFDTTVKQHLERMSLLGPEYAIDDDELICVRLSKDGIKSYHRVYFGRPVYDEKKSTPNGDGVFLYFRCSPEQVFRYFRRFPPYTAQIVQPVSLRKKMYNFFLSGMKCHEKTDDDFPCSNGIHNE